MSAVEGMIRFQLQQITSNYKIRSTITHLQQTHLQQLKLLNRQSVKGKFKKKKEEQMTTAPINSSAASMTAAPFNIVAIRMSWPGQSTNETCLEIINEHG